MKRVAIILALLLLAARPVLAEGVDFSATPPALDINAFYTGATVRVQGEVAEGAQVVMRFVGAARTEHMKRKGKALGLLWMNMDSLSFAGAPTVCLVESQVPVKDLGGAGADLGLEGLSKGFVVEPASNDRASLVSEFLSLKRHEGLYRETRGAVSLGEDKGTSRDFHAELALPSRLSAGQYTLEIFAVKDGQIVARASRPFDVKLVGVPALVADLAFNHGAWYGVLASIIAILAGLGIGMIFQSKEPH